MSIGRSLIFKFLKFGIVGASGMVVHFAILYLLRDVAHINEFVANTAGFITAATTNYFLNRIWTFRSRDQQVGIEYLKFFLISLVGLGINNGTLWLGSRLLPDWSLDWRFYILWIVAVGVTTLWNFTANYLYTFKKTTKKSRI